MQLLSYTFVLLWVITFALYYLVPQKWKWQILLAAGLVFYVISLRGIPVSLLITCATTYACGIYLQKSLASQRKALADCADKERRKTVKHGFEKKRKLVQILYFALNLGLLVFYKYTVVALPFLKAQGVSIGFFEKVIMPLGISFYTLTAISYVVDVGREQLTVEENPWKVLLFLSYFPAVTQGPFNRFAKLQEQFDREHVFDYDRMLRGIQRFVWGAFKKLVIADRMGLFVDTVFASEASTVPGSIFAVAVVFYMLQLYADFSGYMDMALGVSETFDIFLPENFNRPYFSKSVADFWRRWHITLGQWFKDYVMFSFVMSGTGRRITKKAKKKWPVMGKHVTPIIGTMLVWLFTGMWHGRTVSYILWGVYYGLLMSVSLVLETRYPVWKEKYHIKGGKVWGLFCMARTWLIVFVADVLIRSESLAQAGMIYRAFAARLEIGALFSHTVTSYGINKYDFLLLFAALLLWLMVSVWEEQGKDVRTDLAARSMPVRWCCYYGILLMVLMTGIYGGGYDTAAFMYQSF